MAILELFSMRQKKEHGKVPDVFVYDELPRELRVQVGYIVQDALGNSLIQDIFSGYNVTPAYSVYENLVADLCRHFGRLKLGEGNNPQEILANFLLHEPNVQ